MPMAPISNQCSKKEANRGAWTAEEDQRLAQVIEVNGPRRWKAVAAKAGLNRCGKSCRLRWMNYLRPNIKRGNISAQEEDLILRLHKLLGNRWSLIAGRLPGRTDNEIKNYWNSHLSKKIKQKEKPMGNSIVQEPMHHHQNGEIMGREDFVKKGSEEGTSKEDEDSKSRLLEKEFFGCPTTEGPLNLEWVSRFLELDDDWFDFV